MTYRYDSSDDESITLSLDYTDRSGRDKLRTTIYPLELGISDDSDIARMVDNALMDLVENFPHEIQSQWNAIRGYKTTTQKAVAAIRRILATQNL